MMSLKDLAAENWANFEKYCTTVFRSSKFTKIVLVVCGAAAAAAALAIDIARANRDISWTTIVGLVGVGLVAIGSALDVWREPDAAKAIAHSNKILEAAREREQALREHEQEIAEMLQEQGRFDKAVVRGLDLYISMDAMRGAIEQSLDLPDTTISSIVQTCLSASDNSLLGAFDFGIKDIWTICVFMAQPDSESGKIMLRCIAHLRKIPCEIGEARAWPEGVGVAGIAYSMNHEIIIQDMSSADALAMFDLKTLTREYDKVRYASMVAVPINVGTNPKPWGVAVVTSDRANHFSSEPSYGVATAEPIRAIAAAFKETNDERLAKRGADVVLEEKLARRARAPSGRGGSY